MLIFALIPQDIDACKANRLALAFIMAKEVVPLLHNNGVKYGV
jgi:hypothetical protein